jgi:hypothetical protein
MALTKTGTDGIKDDAVTLDKLAHGTSGQDGKFLRANNGAAPSFETVTGTTINNNADNRVITGSGTANTLEGESSLTYNGSDLNISNDVPQLLLTDTNSNNSQGRVRGNGGNLILSADTNAATGSSIINFEIDGTERMRLDTSGRLLIGTTTEGEVSSDDLTIATAAHTGMTIRSGTSHDCTINFSDGTSGADEYRGWLQYNHTNNTMIFGTNAVESHRINNLGDIQIGQVANDCRLGIKQRSGNPHFIDCRDTSSTLKMYVHSSGNLYNTNGSYGQLSDQSLKENIVDAKSQWNDIKNIKIRNFNFTKASGQDTHTQIGCVAQEVEKVSPKLVATVDENGLKTVQTSVLYMKAVKALQEAMAKIEVLETKVAALEAA